MKFCTRSIAAAALLVAAPCANAQVLARGWVTGSYAAVSDFDGPYGPVDAPPPGRYRYGYGYERAPIFLPAVEVYAVLRENGFSPLGAPHLRGDVYLISALDRRGDDGQLVIDARDGRILRFVPADVVGSVHEQRSPSPYGARGAASAERDPQWTATASRRDPTRGEPNYSDPAAGASSGGSSCACGTARIGGRAARPNQGSGGAAVTHAGCRG